MTAPEREKPRRTYAIPFDDVWKAALALADGGLPGWRVVDADDRGGVIVARRAGGLLRREAEIHVRVGLDENAQTRVDVEARGAAGGEARPERRTVALFVARLDVAVDRRTLRAGDAERAPTWSS
jgi:hypothetical protein